tara:strand:+ start:2757 stop:2975 length:219 start_codon:yes stop_codon:yes gene_type:complete
MFLPREKLQSDEVAKEVAHILLSIQVASQTANDDEDLIGAARALEQLNGSIAENAREKLTAEILSTLKHHRR